MLRISSPEFEKMFWDEVFACVKYLKFTLSEVMNMPVYERRNWFSLTAEDNKKKNANGANTASDEEMKAIMDGDIA